MFCTRCGQCASDSSMTCAHCGALLSAEPRTDSASGSDSGGLFLPASSPEASSPLAGEDLGIKPGDRVADRYRIDRCLGTGGMGSVFLAHDETLGTETAIKFLKRKLWRNPATYEHFLQEARICLKLTHENIVRVHHLDLWKGLAYLVMEYLKGGTLRAVIRHYSGQGAVAGWKRSAPLLKQVLSAVGYAHNLGIIHRDLKPDNIMMTRTENKRPRTVVMDFGLSKTLVDAPDSVSGLGTPFYMAPEQMENASGVDARADIYSIGVIAYELLTGRMPQESRVLPSDADPDCPLEINDWVLRALEHDRERRFQNVAEMRLALDLPTGAALSSAVSADNAEQTLRGFVEVALLDGFMTEAKRKTLEKKAETLNFGKSALDRIIRECAGTSRLETLKEIRTVSELLGGAGILELVWVPSGFFRMGSPDDELGREQTEGPQSEVSLEGFWMSKYPITQAQYQQVMGRNPSRFRSDELPVEAASWLDARTFCQKLSELTGHVYELPTEAEWEYACRAGTTTPFSFGDTLLPNQANIQGAKIREAANQTTPVGSFPANPFGLCDMHGNVAEWCLTAFADYPYNETDGRNEPDASRLRVLRGGSWRSAHINLCRSASRHRLAPSLANHTTGFRVVRRT